MAPPVRQTGTTLAGASGTTAVVTIPSGVVAGDVIIVSLYKENTAAVTPPAGYTEKPTAPTTTAPQAQHTFWHRASGSESGTVTFSWTGSVFRAATADRISGCVSSGDPIEGTPSTNSSNASVTTLNVSLAATSTDTLLYWAGTNFAGGNTWTPPSGFTEQADIDVLSCATKSNAAGGATGTLTGTANVSGPTTAVLLDLLPDTGGGPAVFPARPGQTWLRRFHHRQILPQPQAVTAAVVVPQVVPQPFASRFRPPARARVGPSGLPGGGVASQVVTPLGQPSRPRPFVFRSPAPARARTGPAGRPGSGVASAVVTPLGSMPRPMPRPVIQHLPPSRGQAGPGGLAGAGLASGTVTPRGTPGPQWRSQARRPGPARAVWHGGAGPQAIAPVVTAYRRPPAQFPRRTPARALWHGGASRIVTPLGTAGPSWRPQPRRPAPGRAVWHGNAGPPAVAPAAPQAYQRPAPQIRRPGPSRAVTGPRSRPAGGQAGPANAAPVTTAAARPPAQPRSRPPQRAVWHGNASRVVTPLGTPARRPGPVITSRPRSRGLWHGGTGPPPPPASAPPPRWRPLPSRRRPQRARTGGVRGLANAAPPVVTYGTAQQGVMTIPAAAAGQSPAAHAEAGTAHLPASSAAAGQMTIPHAQDGQMPQPSAEAGDWP